MYYDQWNVPNSACCEVLIKRRQLIERAYNMGGADAPNYSGSDHFQGIRESSDGSIIDPALTKYTGDKLHSEYEVTKNARLAWGERGRLPNVPEGEVPAAKIPEGKTGPKGRPKPQGAGGKGGDGK